uniref:Cytochrome P450 n=1 Tax=Chenopodium quinoa TaxID=63459 RepID=A0A803M8U2_CHEQI
MSMQIQSYDITIRSRVISNAWAIRRDPKSWSEPERFNPERFDNCSSDYNVDDFELLLFGAGRRECLGLALGHSKMGDPINNDMVAGIQRNKLRFLGIFVEDEGDTRNLVDVA